MVTMPDDALANAGRAACGLARTKHCTDADHESVARAVLESLGIEWIGEWRIVTYIGTKLYVDGPFASEEFARQALGGTKEMYPRTTPRLQRRPKLIAKWQDVTE